MVSVDQIRARLAAATPGPWRLAECPWRDATTPDVRTSERGDHIACGGGDATPEDAAFIANAPTDIEFLLTLLAERDAQIAALVEFAEWLVSLDDPDPESQGFQDRRTVTLTRIIERARKALDAKGGAS